MLLRLCQYVCKRRQFTSSSHMYHKVQGILYCYFLGGLPFQIIAEDEGRSLDESTDIDRHNITGYSSGHWSGDAAVHTALRQGSVSLYLHVIHRVLGTHSGCALRTKLYPQLRTFIRCPSLEAFHTLTTQYANGQLRDNLMKELALVPGTLTVKPEYLDVRITSRDMLTYREVYLQVQGKLPQTMRIVKPW